jgi:hypothetical protein
VQLLCNAIPVYMGLHLAVPLPVFQLIILHHMSTHPCVTYLPGCTRKWAFKSKQIGRQLAPRGSPSLGESHTARLSTIFYNFKIPLLHLPSSFAYARPVKGGKGRPETKPVQKSRKGKRVAAALSLLIKCMRWLLVGAEKARREELPDSIDRNAGFLIYPRIQESQSCRLVNTTRPSLTCDAAPLSPE